MAPVLASGLSLVPLVVTAGAVAGIAAVARATPARASTGPSVAVVLVNGESSAPETPVLQAAGFTVTQVTPATLSSMSQSTFQGFAAVVIGDSSTSGSCSTTVPSTSSLGTNWEPWVTGHVAVLGTAPARPGTTGADALIADAASYAAQQPSSGSSTGLYLSLNCGYASAAAGTAVSLLSGVEGIGTAGGVTVNGSLACTDGGTVNKWAAASAGTFSGFTSTSLGTGSNGFPSPSCPVEEAFDSWPAMFTPVGYDTASDVTRNFTASDGVPGQPYILLGAPASAATQQLAVTTGGEVPQGTTTGGTNPAAAGVNQATAGDPVNTENGDFSQTDADISIPGYGPSLAFTRTYDADLAQAETETGTPGSLGYGWADNWATSLSTGHPVPGDIYTVDGLETNTGTGGPPTGAAMKSPSQDIYTSSGVYIADYGDNRVLEIPSATGTQWGQSMTAGDIYAIAGSPSGASGASGNGTAASAALLDQPQGLAMDSAGDLFIADAGNERVVELAAATGTQFGSIAMTKNDLYVVAGVTGSAGTFTDSGPATSSKLSWPEQLAVSSNGSLYIADNGSNAIEEVAAASGTQWGQSMTAGDIYTVAGSPAGTAGDSGDGGAATSALLNSPVGVAVDSAGDLLLSDHGNNQVREVAAAGGTQWGHVVMAAGDIYTIAGSTAGTSGTSGDGGLATSALTDGPTGLAIGDGGQLYIDDTFNNRIQEIAATTHTERSTSMTVGDIYTIAGSATGTYGNLGNGGLATSAELGNPWGLAIDGSGNLYIDDTGNYQAREVSASTGDISEYAGGVGTMMQDGENGPAVDAGLDSPDGVATDAQGDIFIADTYGNRVQEISVSNHTQFGITMKAGDVYDVAGSTAGWGGTWGDGTPATWAGLDEPYDVTVDSSGNLYIADGQGMRIQEVPAASGNQWGQSMTVGYMYTIAGQAVEDCGNSGQGGPATSALFQVPSAIATDAAGDVIIEDAVNNQVYVVPAASGTHYGITMTADYLYTIAGSTAATAGSSGDGGLGTSALLNDPDGLAVDPAGNVYVADAGNNRIQEIAAVTGSQRGQSMTAGHIYTIAGSAAGTSGNTGDGGPAATALLHSPGGLSLDASGDLYVIDYANNRVREIVAANGTQWGQSMTAGDIYNVAGNAGGTGGESGDGGPATSALISSPAGIATDPAGDIFLTDSGYSRLREITASTTQITGTSPAGSAVTVTQADGSQVGFVPQSGGSCTAPYVTAGGYCVLPADTGATLTYSSGTYTFTAAPGDDSYSYNSSGQLTAETDTAGDKLTVTYNSPAPGGTVTGNGTCPSSAASCQTITAASGRALVLGWNGSSDSGQVTSVTDPMNRTWTYAYSSGQLTSATDPMTNKTSYTYGSGSTGNPLLANDLLTITEPNAQPGGPDAGDVTVNVYNAAGEVTQQTDPMGFKTTFNYCVSATDSDCMDAATGTGLVTVTDPDGNSTIYDYDQGTLAAQTELTGGTVTSEQDSVPDTTAGGSVGGSLLDTSATDGDGNTTTSAYNSDGNTTSSTSPGANGTPATTTSSYTSTLQAENCQSTAEASSTATCSQDPGPSPVAPAGVITPPSSAPSLGLTYTLYDTDGNALYTTTGVYEPGGSSAAYSQTTYQLFKGNSVTLNSTNIACTYTPPSASLPCATINADGVVTQLEYDTAGDQTLSSTPDGNSGGQLASTTYTYNGDGEQLTKVAPDGNVSGANAGNYTTTTAWNADGKQASATQGNGTGYTDTPRLTSYTYDADSNQTKVEDARGYTTATAYNADDKPTLVTDPDSNATLTCYDGDGNTAQTVPPVGVAANSLTASSCPAAYPAGYADRLASDATVSTFNAQGAMTQKTTPAPAGQSGYETTTYTYDDNGNLLTTTAPPVTNGGSSRATVNTYDSAGQLASQTTASGTAAAATVSFCYDPDNDQTSVVYADGNTSGTASCESSSPWVVSSSAQAAYQTTYSYDSAGEAVSAITPKTAAAPSGATTTSTYDPAENMLTRTDPDGVTTTWTYTPLSLPATTSYSGSSAHSVSFSYDADGNKTGMTDATGTSSYVYDSFGDLTSEKNGAGATTGYAYNADGGVTGITYPLPATATWATTDTVSYGYDHADLLTSVTDFNGKTITVGNTADGLPDSEALGSTGDTIGTTYDPTDAPSAITLKNATTTLQSFAYSDAPAGDILSETDTPSSSLSPADYTYDAQDRVISMTPGTGSAKAYSFDASSNLTTLPSGGAGTYNDAGELTSSSLSGTTTDYSYNADGEQLTATQGSATVASGTWNGAGELIAYDDSAANMTAATYDGNGLRASSSITPSGGSAVTQAFVWDTVPQVPQLIMDSANAYIYDSDPAPAEQVSLATGTITYLVSDQLGSVRGAVNSSGSLTGTTSYDAWGNPETAGGLTAATPFGFAGGYTDGNVLIYLLNRYYDSQEGQFMSPDPMLSQTMEPYGYAAGNPVSNTDPAGYFPVHTRVHWCCSIDFYFPWHVTLLMAEANTAELVALKAGVDYLIYQYVPPPLDSYLVDKFDNAVDDGVAEARDIAGHTEAQRKRYQEAANKRCIYADAYISWFQPYVGWGSYKLPKAWCLDS